MNYKIAQNFDQLSFDNWLDFVFDERWAEKQDDAEYIDISDLNANIEVFAANCIKLFKKPAVLLDKYNSKQLDSGFFSFILSSRMELNWWIWDENNSVDLRREFICSMLNVFKEVFTKNPLKYSCFMWWDSLRNFDDNKDEKTIGWMFETLSQILEIDSVDCQLSALHGLGHLEHSGKKNLIENFLRKHPNFIDKDYALAAIEGKVL